MWITNGGIADVAIVWAEIEADGVRGFIVPDRHPRLRRQTTSTRRSGCGPRSRASSSSRRPRARRDLPGRDGMRGPLSCLNEARFGISGAPPAPAAPATRRRWPTPSACSSAPIAWFQLTQGKLVEMMVG